MIGCDVGSQGTNAALYAADGDPRRLRLRDLRPLVPVTRVGGAGSRRLDHGRRSSTRAGGWSPRCRTGAARSRASRSGRSSTAWWRVDDAGAAAAPRHDLDGPAGRGAGRGPRRSGSHRRTSIAHVGANLDSSHAVFKALWVRDEEPERLRRAPRTSCRPARYVLRHVTGVLAVDYSNASSLALLDPRTRAWSEPVLEATGIDPAMLPELGAGTQAVGTDHRLVRRGQGLVPRHTVARRMRRRDGGHARRRRVRARRGVRRRRNRGARLRGDATSRARTRRCWSSATRTPIPTRGCSRTRASSRAATCGGGGTSSPRSSATPRPRGWATPTTCCRRRRPTSRPAPRAWCSCPCMQGAMAPEWNGAARGVFYGLTLAHTRDHMTRAILEGSAFALRDILEAMGNAGLDVRRLTIVGGGAKGPLWRQIKADVTGLPVRVPDQRRDDGDRRGDPGRGRRRRPSQRSPTPWTRSCPSSPRSTGPTRTAGGIRATPTGSTARCTSP